MSRLFVAFAFYGMVSGHVFLYDPPQRSSLWRHKDMNKSGLVVRNNDDMGLNCGGMWNQYHLNGGKCGVCGDPYDSSPHPDYPHQYPGKYAKGIIGGCYETGSRTMEAEVWVTAHHMGYFEFRLCENNDYTKPVTQACLNRHLLTLETTDGESVGTKYYPDKSKADGIYKIRLVLPPRIQCKQCVLQFLYNAGNSWGCIEDNNCGIGHGNQEQFWNCADIAIVPNCKGVVGSIAPADTTTGHQHHPNRGTDTDDTIKTQHHHAHRETDTDDTNWTEQHDTLSGSTEHHHQANRGTDLDDSIRSRQGQAHKETTENHHQAHMGTDIDSAIRTQQHHGHRQNDMDDTINTQQQHGSNLASLSHLLFQAQRAAAAPAPAVRGEPLEILDSRIPSVTSQSGTKSQEGGDHAAPIGLHDVGQHTLQHVHGSHPEHKIIISDPVSGDKTHDNGNTVSRTSKVSDALESSRPMSRSNQRSKTMSSPEIEDGHLVVENVHRLIADVPSVNSDVVTNESSNTNSCHGTGPWKGDSDMDHWCQVNCALEFCPKSTCSCDNV